MVGDVWVVVGLLILGVNQGASNLITAAAAICFLNAFIIVVKAVRG